MAITKERTEEIVIGDLQEAQHLFERDSSYLKIIGEHYGADISGRGNMIRIKGEEELWRTVFTSSRASAT